MIPFFVADRPMSLRIIKGLPLEEFPDARIGIMAHANTSSNFQEAFNQYPCENFKFCDAIQGPCQYQQDISKCPARQRILSQTIKMCDSGIFTREGATLTYTELFEAYKRMGVQYGIMIDVFRDADATIDSARKALEAYTPYCNDFKLVVVAQGESVEDYIRCYEALRGMGFEHIAVGGLLQKVSGTARYTQVRDEAFMFEVLEEIRERYPDAWLFALGCLHPTRQDRFKELDVWGDYKGWIFQYEKRNETLNAKLERLTGNHLAHPDGSFDISIAEEIRASARKRLSLIAKHKKLVKELNTGKRQLKELLQSIYEKLSANDQVLAAKFDKVRTHGLLKTSEEPIVQEALKALGVSESKGASALWKQLKENRRKKATILSTEKKVEVTNRSILSQLRVLMKALDNTDSDLGQLCTEAVQIISKGEQEHRLGQVREMMSETFLAYSAQRER